MGVAGIGRSSLGGSGGMTPRKFLNFEPSESGSEALIDRNFVGEAGVFGGEFPPSRLNPGQLSLHVCTLYTGLGIPLRV